jgi:hypothetical protein
LLIPPALLSFIFKEFSIKQPVILAIGAAGKFAGLIVPALALRGGHVRAFIRDAKQEGAARAKGAFEIAVGDLREQTSDPRTWWSGYAPAVRSISPTRPLSTAKGRKATPTIRRGRW